MTTPQTSSTNDVSYQKITKKVASSKDNKKLSVLSPTFERHPSASKLLNATEAKDPLIFEVTKYLLKFCKINRE